MIRRNLMICAAVIAALATTHLQAATIFWQGGPGTLTQANYSDGTNTGLAPTAADIVNFGNGGSATHSVAGTTTFSRLRVGHNNPPPPMPGPGGGGQGTVTINTGAINLGGAGGAGNGGLQVGRQQNGTLNIDGPTSSVTVGRLIEVGYGTTLARMGTINITNGGSLTATLGNINLGGSSGTAAEGNQGHLFVNGNVTVTENGADLIVGNAAATSSFTLHDGSVSVGDSVEVGSGGNDASFVTINGGTLSTGNGGNGNISVGRSSSTNATFNINGGIVNVGNRYLMGAGTATGAVTNHVAGTVNIEADYRIGDSVTSATSDSTYNFSGGTINSLGTTANIVGRQGIGRFFQSGGQANLSGSLAIGSREVAGAPATDGLYEISGGQLNVDLALNIATNGVGEFRVVGDDGLIDVDGNFTVDNTANGVGTLAYELEAGDSLSMIDVAGTATFNAGSVLIVDASNAGHEQFQYNLLTAPTIVDDGITFSAPAGWWYRIIDGGNGKILQAIVPEPSSIGLVILALSFGAFRRRG